MSAADEKRASAAATAQAAEPEAVAVGKRCRRILSMDEEAMNRAIHTDFGLDPMTFLPDMDVLDNGMFDRVLDAVEAYDPDAVTAADVRRVLDADVVEPADFGVLVAPAAAPFLEEMAERARAERVRWFGTNIQFFTPLYLANYCENRCVYCGFNCESGIHRARLNEEQTIAELDAIAATGQEEILLLTGEDPVTSDVDYIARACELAAERFKNVGICARPVPTLSPCFRRPMIRRATPSFMCAAASALCRTALRRKSARSRVACAVLPSRRCSGFRSSVTMRSPARCTPTT